MLDRHCTHAPAVVQRGTEAGQSLLTWHAAQACVWGLQVFADAGQSVEDWHSTHSPDPVMQMGAGAGHPELAVHGAWQP
jgi:hypothetical protein